MVVTVNFQGEKISSDEVDSRRVLEDMATDVGKSKFFDNNNKASLIFSRNMLERKTVFLVAPWIQLYFCKGWNTYMLVGPVTCLHIWKSGHPS
jgi:hypothetical protein